MTVTFVKRQKEMKRKEKQREKAERREQKKLAKRAEKEAAIEGVTPSAETFDQPVEPEIQS